MIKEVPSRHVEAVRSSDARQALVQFLDRASGLNSFRVYRFVDALLERRDRQPRSNALLSHAGQRGEQDE